MLIRLDSYNDLRGNKVKGVDKRTGRKVNGIPVVTVNSADLTSMQDNWHLFNGIIFEYQGSLDSIRNYSFDTLTNKIVFRTAWVDSATLNKLLTAIPYFVDLVVDLTHIENPLNLRDMIGYCQIDKRIRFIGREVLNTGEIRMGYCDETMFSGKQAVNAVLDGTKGVYEEFTLDELEEVSWTEFKAPKSMTIKTSKVKTPKAPKEPKEKKEPKPKAEKKPKYDLSIFNL